MILILFGYYISKSVSRPPYLSPSLWKVENFCTGTKYEIAQFQNVKPVSKLLTGCVDNLILRPNFSQS